MITFRSALAIAITFSAVFGNDGIAEKPVGASFAVITRSVKEAFLADASHPIAGIRICHFNVPVAFAGFAVVCHVVGLPVITWAAFLAKFAFVVGFADAGTRSLFALGSIAGNGKAENAKVFLGWADNRPLLGKTSGTLEFA